MTRIHEFSVGIQKLENLLEKFVFLKYTFAFPPTVKWSPAIFQYVLADIMLYSKSLDSTEMIKFWLRTSSHPHAHVGAIASKPGVVPQF